MKNQEYQIDKKWMTQYFLIIEKHYQNKKCYAI